MPRGMFRPRSEQAWRRPLDGGNLLRQMEPFPLVLYEAAKLSEDGFVLPIIAINKHTGRVETSPEIVTRGFNPGDNGLLERAREIVMETLEQSSNEEKADYGVIKEKIRADLKRYISKQTQRRPLIMPVILEV